MASDVSPSRQLEPDETAPIPATRLVNAGRAPVRSLGFVNPPVVRGSTVLHADCAERAGSGRKILDQALIYGIEGTPTHWALEDMVAEIEGGTRCQIVSTGLAAVTTALLAFARAGAHFLVPDSVYGPTRQFCDSMLTRLGVSIRYYPPTLDAAAVAALFQPETALLFAESPGSHTFEMQDVPALCAVAKARAIPVLLDNTWGIRFFRPFAHGVDVSIQALTKYVGGHSDLVLGAITVSGAAYWERIRMTAMQLGAYASPDDCWLALRGARTLAVRLDHQMQSGLAVARWLATRPEVLEVRHPALPGAAGHEIWRRDYSGAPSLFGVVFRPPITAVRVAAMIDTLTLFGIGASWGGYESLALPSIHLHRVHGTGLPGPTARFHIGLEDVDDLIADLAQAFPALDD